jgi:signal transduction histidine kinase/DNA-binding response OmpR family regulator
MTVPDPVLSAFAGPGELRALFREKDWSATPLGDPHGWSPVLRTMVQNCLNSGFPILIHWGPELVALYNDAYGSDRRQAPGRPGRTGPEHLGGGVGPGRRPHAPGHPGGPDAACRRRAIAHGAQRVPRGGLLHLLAQPIVDVDGSTAGMLTVSTETTAKVLYERRMRVVRELGGLSSAEAGRTSETCRAALQVLRTARETMPCAVAFLREEGGATRRVADYGLAPDACLPGITETGPESPAGVVDRVIATGHTEEVTGLREFPDALLPGPLGPSTPDTAVVVPLTISGRAGPIGALVLGVNPYRRLDGEYRSFFTLIGRQIGVALTDTVAYEGERVRAQLLADLDRAKMEFFQNVSHELRTPLTLLLAPLQDLLAAGNQDSPERDDLEAAVRAAQRLRGMVDALLDFAGAEAGTLNPDRQPTDLAGLTADVASMFRSTAEHAGLEFTVDLPPSPVTARVDRAMWTTIVTNLLSNAVKYTQQGAVRIRLDTADGQAVLVVKDTGSGISPDQQQRVFERFYRAGAEVTEGVGIGLALVADLVHAHLGQIDLVSTNGNGTMFTVTVPLAVDAGRDGAEQSGTTDDGAALPRVLLVEDDSDLRAYLTRLLTSDGWSVRGVPDAETALAAMDLTDGAVDLVITDVMLPGRSGLHLVEQLRHSSRNDRLPIIVLTARHGTAATSEGLAAGADDYITKPFSSQELLARVRANHELAKLRQSAVDEAEERASQIRNALDSNRMIGTAVGIVMAKYRLTATQGFQLLVTASQHSNRKLRDLAADTVQNQKMPLRPTVTDQLLIKVAAGRS